MQVLRNIGIFAHVDAGKTTLSECMLSRAGAIRAHGEVDSGTAHTDRMDIERRRGISVVATTARLHWRGVDINLIDTPGHADFACEVERSLWALDGAVLVLSAVEGVQPQTEVLFRALSKRAMPAIFFINKIDREGASVDRTLQQIRTMLGASAALLDEPASLQEAIAEHDEQALDDYLEGKLYNINKLRAMAIPLCHDAKIYPALSGCALRNEGIAPLLDAVIDMLPAPVGDSDAPLCGIVYAVNPGSAMGRAAQVRLFSGSLKNRDPLTLSYRGDDGLMRKTEAKITQIRGIALEGQGEDLGQLQAGEIGTIYGLGDVRAGQVIGDRALLPRRISMGELGVPLLMVKVEIADKAKLPALRLALTQLCAEDPLLGASEYGGEPHIKVMGAIQLEILGELLRSRFDLNVEFGPPRIIYRETIAKTAVGFYAYTMPKPCWAVIKFQIEPLPRGRGVEFSSVVPVKEIMQRYQNQVRQAIPLAIKQGMLGFQVDDVKITLIGGEHHLIHTHPLDFIVATPIAFLDGMRRGGSKLLEPLTELRITVPGEYVGKMMSEVAAMRGTVLSTETAGHLATVTAEVPLATSTDFSIRLPQLTSGRGAMSIRHIGYQDAPADVMATCPRQGVHPLDTSKYILASRSALDGELFDL